MLQEDILYRTSTISNYLFIHKPIVSSLKWQYTKIPKRCKLQNDSVCTLNLIILKQNLQELVHNIALLLIKLRCKHAVCYLYLILMFCHFDVVVMVVSLKSISVVITQCSKTQQVCMIVCK